MKEYFKTEAEKTITDIKKARSEGDLCFALLSDSHLCDESTETCENISAVDKEINFDFIAHLGNITNGDNPEKITRWLMQNEIEKFKNTISAKKLFVTQGENDGWRDENFKGQMAKNIITDDMWYEETSYMNLYPGVSRKGNKPYYYVDLPEYETRLVFLCTYTYQINSALGLFDKHLGIDIEQTGWLMTEALNVEVGTNVILFSHRIPKSRFENGNDTFVYNGYATEQTLAILQQAKNRGINIVCWFGGGYGYDSEINVAGINHAVINSQLPRCITSAECDGIRFSSDRENDTLNQDCWDAVVVKRKERCINIYRFGAGEDRSIVY